MFFQNGGDLPGADPHILRIAIAVKREGVLQSVL
jgi:hypothetical protein